MPVEIVLRGMSAEGKTATARRIWHEDVNAANTLEAPDTVAIGAGEPVTMENGVLRTSVLRHSVNMITLR